LNPPTMEKMCSSLTLQYLHNIIIVHVSPRDVLSSVEEYTFLCKTVVSIIIILEVNVLHDSSPNQTWIGECLEFSLDLYHVYVQNIYILYYVYTT